MEHLKAEIRNVTAALLLIILTAASLPFGAAAQATAKPDNTGALAAIEAKIDARRKELGIPGAALVIVKDGKIIFLKGLGYRDLEGKIAVTPDTQFPIGSATKAFTALAVLMAQDEGKLSLEDSPKQYLPYFKINDPDTDKAITIRDLLRHSSGLMRTDLAMLSDKLDRKQLIEVAGEAKPTAKLGAAFQYQNIMFAAAGEIVATVEKEPWETFVTRRILKPLKMYNTTTTLAGLEKAKDRSLGYLYNAETKATRRLPYRDITASAPAGSINSSVRDMAKWLEFVMNDGTAHGKRLVSDKGFEEWLKPQMKISPDGTMSYGLGWFLQKWHGLTVVQHGGSIDGFNSMVAMIPEKKLGFALLTNVSGSPLTNEAMEIVWSQLLPEMIPAKKEEAAAPNSTKEASPETLIGKYTGPGGAEIEIKSEGGNVTFNISGQQPYKLVPRPNGGYAMEPLPAVYWLGAKRGDAGKVTAVVVNQPEGQFEFKLKTENEKPPIAVDELMQKMIDARGGEANWRKIKTRVATFDVELENQGVKGAGTSWAKAPSFAAAKIILTALGRPIGTEYTYFDGKGGEEQLSFFETQPFSGKRLADAAVSADFYDLLNWKKNWASVAVTGTEKVNGEDCYVVKYTSEKGTNRTEYVSEKTFLTVRRVGEIASDLSSQALPYRTDLSDYRDAGGILMPFREVTTSAIMGKITTTIRSVEVNVPVDDKVFGPVKFD